MRQKIIWALLVMFTFSVAVAQESHDILFEDNFEVDDLAQWGYDTNLSFEFVQNSSTPHFFFESRSTSRGAYSGFIWLRESNSYMGLGGPLNGEWGNLLIEQLDFDAPANPQVSRWHDVEMIVNANIIELY